MEVAKHVLEVGFQFFLFGGGVAKQFLGMACRKFFGSGWQKCQVTKVKIFIP